ncbi:MAG: VWA domain-containing protein [Brucellaceae bacterium]|nr:VWA domain-containing protein [Brucellaceae bacterium]
MRNHKVLCRKVWKETAARFRNDRKGNFTVLFVGTLIPTMMCIGFVVDSVSMMNLKNRAENVTDSALMAAAATVRENGTLTETDEKTLEKEVDRQMRDVFKVYFEANSTEVMDRNFESYNLSYDPETNDFTAKVNLYYKPHVYKRLYEDTVRFSVQATVNVQLEQQGALSMGLVLDKSGSMGSNGRMTALKQAVASMAADFDKSDPKNELIRLGAWSYDSTMRDSVDMTWDRSEVSGFVKSLKPGGGTSSTKAFQTAWQQVRHPREEKEHEKMNGLTLRRAVVFMTDGDNNDYKDDDRTIKFCDKAKDDGLEVYTVAFQAPARGKNLLKACASGADHYYEATNAASLITAFRKIGRDAMGKILFSH